MGKAEELLDALDSIGLFSYRAQTGDEQDFVDRRVVIETILPWLGWEARDYEYNRMNAGSKPDFLVKTGSLIAFFIEDKSTSESLSGHEPQVLEYLKKFSRRGIVCNGFRLWVVELKGNAFKVAYDIDFLKAKGGLFPEKEKSAVERFYREFSKEKFTNLENRIDTLASSEKEFLSKSVSLNGREEVFIEEAYRVVKSIYSDVYVRVKHALEVFEKRQDLLEEAESRISEALDRLLGASPTLEGEIKEALKQLKDRFTDIIKSLGYLTPEEIADAENPPGRLTAEEKERLKELVSVVRTYNSALQNFQVTYSDELSLAEGFLLWLEGWREFLSHSTEKSQKQSREESIKEYALQVAYAFFVKVFILRILEDKGLMKRLLTNGGFALWREITKNLSLIGSNGEIRLNLLFSLAVSHVRDKMFSDIEKNRVYDWYIPDDLLFIDLLELMSKYNFADVKQDIIGYVYEKLMEHTHRHELGIYLTPPQIVDYMLDILGYKGREIIGKKLIDPACGSGTFLVHAVRRYREALKNAIQSGFEEKFIRDVQELFWGMDINSFSVYLASINLFVQILDDIKALISSGKEVPLISFKIQVGNTFRLYGQLEKEKFHYVVSNPPYVNAKRANFSPPEDLLKRFRDRLGGDVNTYTLFLCIASEVLYNGGRIAYIVPLTLLGDQQAEKLRKFLSKYGTILHLTKFHRRTNVLFEGVTQAVVVFVWEKAETDKKTVVGWGGVVKEDRGGMIEEAKKNVLQVDRAVYHLDKPADKVQNSFLEKGKYVVWIALSGKDTNHAKKLYGVFGHITSHEKTLRDFLLEMGVDVEQDFRQGDVNTSYVASYHVFKSHPKAMPLYKGEDLRPFGVLPEEPAGVKGRDGSYRPGYVAPKEGGKRVGVNRTLWEIYETEKEEWLVLLNEKLIGLNHPRGIRGCVSHRGAEDKKVFAHTVWVVKFPDEVAAKKTACLLFSLPFTFQYNAVNTNLSLSKNILMLLKVPDTVPDEVVDYYNCLEHISSEFRKLGIEDITEHLNLLWYNLKEGVKFERLVPWEVIVGTNPTISLEDFLLRYAKRVAQPRGGRIESYLREDYWRFSHAKAKFTIALFREKFKNERYDSVKGKPLLPDNPTLFADRLESLKNRFYELLSSWGNTLRELDTVIIRAYGLSAQPEDLVMPLIR